MKFILKSCGDLSHSELFLQVREAEDRTLVGHFSMPAQATAALQRALLSLKYPWEGVLERATKVETQGEADRIFADSGKAMGTAPGNLGGLADDPPALAPCPCPHCCNKRASEKFARHQGSVMVQEGAPVGHQSICDPVVTAPHARFVPVRPSPLGDVLSSGWNVLDTWTGRYRLPTHSLTFTGAQGSAKRANEDPHGMEDNYRY